MPNTKDAPNANEVAVFKQDGLGRVKSPAARRDHLSDEFERSGLSLLPNGRGPDRVFHKVVFHKVVDLHVRLHENRNRASPGQRVILGLAHC